METLAVWLSEWVTDPAGPELERRWLGLQTISIPLDGGLETSAACTRPFLGGDPSARQTHGGGGGYEGRERDANGGFTRREVTMAAWGTSTMTSRFYSG